jgi:chromate transporter
VAQIAMMHEEIVVRKRWVDEAHFQHALNYCILLPGPEAQQLATYMGWLLHGLRGGIAAGLLFILPSIAILLGFATLYAHFGQVPLVAGFFMGLKPAVFALIVLAAIRIGKKNLRHDIHVWTACVAVALSFVHFPFMVIVLLAAAAGWYWRAYYVAAGPGLGSSSGSDPVRGLTPTAPTADVTATMGVARVVGAVRATLGRLRVPSFKGIVSRLAERRVWRPWAMAIGLWMLPLLLCYGLSAYGDWFRRLSFFYTGTALFSFGGAYTVLPYVWQGAVHDHGWITATQMMDALALGESTPGPLIMIVAFVGHLSTWNQLHIDGGWRDLWAVWGGLIAVWYTFLPSFLLILVGSPWVEKARHLPNLSAPLAAVSCAVVGMIGMLALQSLAHVVTGASLAVDGVMALMAAVILFIFIRRPRIPVWAVVLGSGGVGAIIHLF